LSNGVLIQLHVFSKPCCGSISDSEAFFALATDSTLQSIFLPSVLSFDFGKLYRPSFMVKMAKRLGSHLGQKAAGFVNVTLFALMMLRLKKSDDWL
jgi:hypothetical protein